MGKVMDATKKPLFVVKGKGGKGKIKLLENELIVQCSCGCGVTVHLDMLKSNWRVLHRKIESILHPKAKHDLSKRTLRRRRTVVLQHPDPDHPSNQRKRKKTSRRK
jgi:anaerobic selenocysteine-containing dehydrogenase